jgi:Tol biopolymer transport system component
MRGRRVLLSVACLVNLLACMGGAVAPVPSGQSGPAVGVLTYVLYLDGVGHLFRLDLETGLSTDLTLALDERHGIEVTEMINVSPDGLWLVVETESGHADCAGWACLAVVPADLSLVTVVQTPEGVLHAEGAAIASGGQSLVFVGGGGPHERDLFVVEAASGGWSSPSLLTGDSSHAHNHQPAFSADGRSLVFDCGPQPYGAEGTAVCEVSSSAGAEVTERVSPRSHPDLGRSEVALHSPHYAANGEDLIFEADWQGEQIWTWHRRDGRLTAVDPDRSNDSTPCALADGSVVSFWLERPEGEGEHEIKRVAVDGSWSMVLIDVDVADGILGCGGG